MRVSSFVRHILGFVTLAAFTATAPARLAAQRVSVQRQEPVGVITGVVYDSLRSQPLVGARVLVSGSSLAATTDSSGLFRIDSVPVGEHQVFFEHPDLDSIGVASNPRRVTVQRGRLSPVSFSLPSLGTIYGWLCPGQARPGPDSGVVFGSVLDVQTGYHLARARVSLVTTGGGLDTVSARTDSLGNFYFCRVPVHEDVLLVGQAGLFSSGWTVVRIGERSVARREIAIDRGRILKPGDSVALRQGRATIIGTVLTEQDAPLPGARAAVDGSDAAGISSETGAFVLSDVPAGSRTLTVRMVGYSAALVAVRLRGDDTLRLTVRLGALVVLDTINVRAMSRLSQILLNEMEERRYLGTSGYFIPGSRFNRASSVRTAVQTLPQILVTTPRSPSSASPFELYSLVGIRTMAVRVYVDGEYTSVEVLSSYRPDQIIAMEWFPRGTSAPFRYQSGGSPVPPVLLVWTRNMF